MKPAKERYDVIIIGGGPAGISAALWCADLGLETLLIDRNQALGGQLLWTHNPITNYPGIRADNGAEMAERFAASVSAAAIETLTGIDVRSVDLAERRVTLSENVKLQARAIVIATGVRRRQLGIAGEREFAGRGILSSGAGERNSVKGKTVVIVGGGDAALENALILGEHAAKVVVIHRRSEFAARDEFIDAARSQENVEFIFDATVTAINGDDRVRSVDVKTHGGVARIECDAVLIRIGVEPNTELFAGQLAMNEDAYIIVDKELRAKDGVWAVGDVTGTIAMTIANAVGQGSIAAKSIKAEI